jgi:hypothetical protein
MGKPASGAADAAPFDPTPAERQEMVAVAAYYLAERRDFAPGGEEADWLLAEQQIERLLERARAAGLGREALARLGLRNALRLWAE